MLGEAEACDPYARRFLARAMTMTPLVGTAGYFEPEGADLSLLNGGRCPVLLDHDTSVRSAVGIVEAAWVEAGAVVVIGRMGHGELAETAWQNIRAGVWLNVSLANHAEEMAREGEGYVIRRWRPYELSLVWSGWCPDAQITSCHDLARLHGIVETRRQERAEVAARAAADARIQTAAALRARYRLVALEVAAELGVGLAEAEAAAERAAARFAAAMA